MNKILSFISFSTLVSNLGCRNPSPTNDSSYKAAVTTLAILAILPADTAFKNDLKRRLPSARFWANNDSKSASEKNRRLKKLDSIEQKIDTAKIQVKVGETLITMDPHYLKSKLRIHHNNPSSLYAGLEKWEAGVEIINDEKLLSAHYIPDKGGYSFLLTNNIDSLSGDWLSAGNVQVSEVYFNHDRTKAFLYTKIICGNLCGAGYDVFLEKRQGQWVLVKKIMGWVS